ncbi:hypothetical protein AT15_00315 [Kosmotoga arenicorallina S304]|uniref:DUF4382 domain-containing protein n=1 Tax=Kosmotoga arenicorallina S304 TaxID=1453497 RepID=A0A176K0L5_9BACT|nr:hypothetical protein [Kosmotoga arenicorallina]OAA30185.1 hypothetical protein AT15_00315 [Kosmotoga arenicorallina S304]
MKKEVLVLAFLISIFLMVSCSTHPREYGVVFIRINIPESVPGFNYLTIPPDTTKVYLRIWNDSDNICLGKDVEPGINEIKVQIPTGTYTLDVFTLKESYVTTGAGRASNVEVKPNEFATATVIIEPFEYDISETATFAYSGEQIHFRSKIKVPEYLSVDLANWATWIRYSLDQFPTNPFFQDYFNEYSDVTYLDDGWVQYDADINLPTIEATTTLYWAKLMVSEPINMSIFMVMFWEFLFLDMKIRAK